MQQHARTSGSLKSAEMHRTTSFFSASSVLLRGTRACDIDKLDMLARPATRSLNTEEQKHIRTCHAWRI